MSGLGTLRLNFVWPITLTEDNQKNQSDIKPTRCPRRKAREKAYQQVTTGFKLNFDWPRKWRPNIVTKGLGCVPLGWFGFESVIRGYSDHGKSNEPMKSFKRINLSSPLMYYNPIDPITEPSSGSSQGNAPLVASKETVARCRWGVKHKIWFY